MASQNSQKKILVLGTGGTIAGRASVVSDNIGYKAGEVGVDDLLAGIPGLTGGPFHLVSEQVAQVDSKDMDVAVWQRLAIRLQGALADPTVQGIVITHGTDTLEETAYFLHALLDPDKPVVLTCAMRPATALTPDGPQNLLDAVAVASNPQARGVVAVCAGTIHSAVDVQKIQPYRVDAFGSGDAGPVGYVEESALRIVRNWPSALVKYAPPAIKNVVGRSHFPRVEIVMSHAGASGAVVQALMAHCKASGLARLPSPLRGLVVAATGNGSVHQDMEAGLLEAQASGVAVVRATRCPLGRVLSVPDTLIPDSAGLSPVKARIDLMLRLAAQDAGV